MPWVSIGLYSVMVNVEEAISSNTVDALGLSRAILCNGKRWGTNKFKHSRCPGSQLVYYDGVHVHNISKGSNTRISKLMCSKTCP